MQTDNETKTVYFNTKEMPWEKIKDEHIGKSFFDLKMVNDAETGVTVNASIYPAGYYKTKHVHTCAHGIFVLKGTLKTDEGEFGAGTFVWYPEGVEASHGATDKEECVFLYITNKNGILEYLE